MNGDYKVLKEEVTTSPNNHKYKLVDAVIRTPAGKEVDWEYIKARDGVTIVAINSKNQIFVVRQWRPARKDYVWELPAGGIEIEHPTLERVFQNANRELQEEISFKANKIELLSSFSPAIHMACTYYVVLARDLEASPLPNGADEKIETKAMPFDEAFDLLVNRELPSASTLVGMILAKQRLG